MNSIRVVLVSAMMSLSALAFAAGDEDLAKEAIKKAEETKGTKATPTLIIEKVNQAVKLIESDGEKAFSKFKGGNSDFIFAGTYIWIHNLADGVMLVHPIKPKMQNTPQLGLKDQKGKAIFVLMNNIVKEKGEGWLEYTWPKPGETKGSNKISYVKGAKHGGKTYVIGCGAYDITMEEILKAAGH